MALVLFAGCSPKPWNVLLLTMDTTRADFIGAYGKESARTANLDQLAEHGLLFEQAFSSNPVTQASHSTILTGVYPMVHGVRDNGLFQLPEKRSTLAEILKAEGYATGAAVGGFPLTTEFGTQQGFDFYDDDLTADREDFRGRPAQRERSTWYDERPAGHVNDAILPWLRQERDQPFFAWLHYWDPHEPHIAPPPYNQLFAHDPYQGEIAYADDSLGTILRYLKESGELERTLIVVTADHGESRHQHNEVTHAFLAYSTTLHVPLILNVPGHEGGIRVRERVGTVDIVPTVLDLLGIEGPKELQGRSLAPFLDGEEEVANRRAYYSESLSPKLSHGLGELRVLYRGPWKYIHGPRPELFNLQEDPLELHDLTEREAEQVPAFRATLQEFLNDHSSPDAADAAYEADEDTLKQLAALGYLSTSGSGETTTSETLTEEGVVPQDRVGDINLMLRLRKQLDAGNFAMAKKTTERLLVFDPDNAFYRAKLARALAGLGDLEQARRLVEESSEVNAINVNDFLLVAQALFDSGEQESGLEITDQLVSQEPSVEGYLRLAEMSRELDSLEGYAKAIGEALELEPENRRARLEKVKQLTLKGDYSAGETEARALLGDFPADPAAHLAIAKLRRLRNDGSGALESIDRALRLAPAECRIHLEKVELLLQVNRPNDAEVALTQLRRRCGSLEIRNQAVRLVEGYDVATK